MYEEKQDQYFSYVRKSLLDLIPEANKNSNILEIGAGTGATLLFAKDNGYAKHISGIELCKIENSNQESNEFDNFIIGNIETMSLPFKKKSFDVIICGDVLEHLINPIETLIKLQPYLKPDAVLIASIPNIREWDTMKLIFFKGDFKYQDAGILDKTHLRFFCKKNMIELFEKSGYTVQKISNKWCHEGPKIFFLNKILPRLFEEFMTGQYLFVAQVKSKK